jgi:TonB family protein
VEFSREALRVAHAWKFEPARIAGQPVTAVVPVTIAFETNGMLTRVKQFDEPARRETKLEYQAWNSQDLDAPPKLLWTVSPQYPEQLGKQGITGRVILDFYIDETGRVRFPRARPPANAQLAALAIKAVKVWAFDPPIRHGVPVLAYASTSFLFEP